MSSNPQKLFRVKTKDGSVDVPCDFIRIEHGALSLIVRGDNAAPIVKQAYGAGEWVSCIEIGPDGRPVL